MVGVFWIDKKNNWLVLLTVNIRSSLHRCVLAFFQVGARSVACPPPPPDYGFADETKNTMRWSKNEFLDHRRQKQNAARRDFVTAPFFPICKSTCIPETNMMMMMMFVTCVLLQELSFFPHCCRTPLRRSDRMHTVNVTAVEQMRRLEWARRANNEAKDSYWCSFPLRTNCSLRLMTDLTGICQATRSCFYFGAKGWWINWKRRSCGVSYIGFSRVLMARSLFHCKVFL